MGDKKVFCRRASELKSIDELNLSDDVARLLNSSDMSMEEMVAVVRYLNMGFLDSQYFWLICLEDRTNLDIDDEEWDELVNGGYGHDYLLEIKDSLERTGFLNDDIKNLGYAAMKYSSVEDFHAWRDLWLGGDDVLISDGFREFNGNYESFEGGYEKKVERILDIIRNGLTINQYNMAKFDLTHPRLPFESVGMGTFVWSYPVKPEDVFVLGEEDYSNLRAAQYNCKGFFKDEIMEIILS